MYNALNFFSKDYKDNAHIRDQIVLGSILGDGFIQNRSGKYVYRECHALQEEEYLKWKFLKFDDWTAGNNIYDKNKNNAYCDAKEFATKVCFSDVFEEYSSKPIEAVIAEMDIYGLLIFVLDDGWYSSHSKRGNIAISSGELTDPQLQMIVSKFGEYSIEASTVGQRRDITINSKYNFVLLSYLDILFDGLLDIDVITKKFQKIIYGYKNFLS